MSPNKARANEVERTPTTNDIVLFWSPATWTRKARCGTKIYEQWRDPMKRVRVNNFVKPNRGWWHKYYIQSKQVALPNINRNQRLGLSSRSPCVGAASGLLKPGLRSPGAGHFRWRRSRSRSCF